MKTYRSLVAEMNAGVAEELRTTSYEDPSLALDATRQRMKEYIEQREKEREANPASIAAADALEKKRMAGGAMLVISILLGVVVYSQKKTRFLDEIWG